jgi:hypothetical protein
MNLEIYILKILSDAGGYMVNHSQIPIEIKLRGGEVTFTEVNLALCLLEEKGHVIGINNPDAPGGSKWKLTDAGKARLAEAIL